MHRGRVRTALLLALALAPLWGCASAIMQPAPTLAAPETSQALVTFLRPTYFGGAIQFGIWDEDRFVGILSAGSYVQYLAAPGEHVFLARAENWSYVRARLEGGRRYYILGKVFPGVWKARVAFDPVRRADPTGDDEIERWLEELKPTEVVPEKREAYAAPRLVQVGEAVQAFRSGQVTFEVLEVDDFRPLP